MSQQTDSAVRQSISAALRESQELDTHMEELMRRTIRDLFHSEAKQFGLEIEAVKDNVAVESQERCAGIADVHARLARDLGGVRIHIEEARSALEEAARSERAERCDEAVELRGILDSVWHQTRAVQGKPEAGSNKKHFFRYGEAGQEEHDGSSYSYKECLGDQEDVMTLYELVQESLGESVRLAKDFEELKATTSGVASETSIADLADNIGEKFEKLAKLVDSRTSILSIQAQALEKKCSILELQLEANMSAQMDS